MLFFFFFSSRRRHTRYWRDWSSDVCSSDLAEGSDRHRALLRSVAVEEPAAAADDRFQELVHHVDAAGRMHPAEPLVKALIRSEERRVGKECRSRWSPYH